jgi:broad specificity phosphatase PhoE
VSSRPIFIARHGETQSNLTNLYAGRSPEPLTRAGRAQVTHLAGGLAALGIGQIWTSSIGRALESARLLGERLRVSVRVDSRLDEMQLGPWEGRTEEEVARDFPDAHALWLSQPDQVRMEGRETLGQVAARVMAAVADAEATRAGVLLMTHVAPMRVAVLSVLRCPLAAYKRLVVPNASCVRLDRVAEQATWSPEGTSLRLDIERAGSVAA